MTLRRILMALLFAAVGCGTDAPTETDARASYAAQKTTIDQVDAGVRGAIAQVAWFGPEEGPDSPRGALGFDPERDDAERAQAVKAIEGLAAQPSVRGILVTYRMTPSETVQEFARAGDHPRASHNDSTHLEQGITIDGKKVGWGLFQTSEKSSLGSPVYQPGLELQWDFTQGPAQFQIELALLSEGGA